MSKHEEKENGRVSYKETLNLPSTDFPIRAQAHIFDPELLERWSKDGLSEKTFHHNKGKETFILHDGPPYANGSIHLGHAYNKILKDIIAKSERMTGKHVPVTPGWDCHGLPIELKVAAETQEQDAVAFKKACRTYATKWINVQREEFKKLGVMMDWDNPYLTMNPEYEARTVRALGSLVKQGYIERKQKTVPWCMSCKTVLATAEIEYEERKDPSIYVKFPFEQSVADKLFPQVAGEQVSLLIWTTTPWTLPLNRAVVLKPKAAYQLIKIKDQLVILGKELVAKLGAAMEEEPQIIAEIVAEDLIDNKVCHPFVENLQVPVITDHFVSLEDGTACVHSAPGCGPDDYDIGLKNNLEIYSPISEDGCYTDEIAPAELAGMPVSDGQIWVIKKLASLGMMLFKKSLRHPYPHCWRCHKGLIFRATKQWFCDLSKNDLKDKALQAIDAMRMFPQSGKSRLHATVEGRLEWCLSRQRRWGTPIPAVACLDCDHVATTPELIEAVARGVEKDGIEYWDTVDVTTLPDGDACKSCNGNNVDKEKMILDVWFDAGVSHYAVLNERDDLQFPADVYLEGKDQHRGWFQSSLLTSLALENAPSMKEIITHGFTVDGKGRKMSKSIGNVVSPFDIIKRMGTDGLRLWVASNDYDSDPVVSDALMNNVAEVYRKIRNTCRFLLSNMYDFDFDKDAVSIDNLLPIDQYALCQLHELNEKIKQSYKDRKTTAVFHELADYCVKELSSFYLDIVKDRLYVEKVDGIDRRSAQTTCHYILDTLTKVMAPILSFTSELIADNYQSNKESIHLQDFTDLKNVVALLPQVDKEWSSLRAVRSLVLKSLESLREQGEIKHSLDARVQLFIDDSYAGYEQVATLFEMIKGRGQDLNLFFKEFLIVSQFQLSDSSDGLQEVAPGVFVQSTKATGGKCGRCWQWEAGEFDDTKQLCQRCETVLN